MHIDIRSATSDDLQSLQAIARNVIDADYRSFLGSQGTDQIISSGAIDQYLEDNLEHCFVVVTEAEVAGFAICKDGLIALMMIAPQARGQGVGAALLSHCETAMFRDRQRLTLESFQGNTRAHGFYQRHGWRLSERNEHAPNGIVTYVFTKSKPS